MAPSWKPRRSQKQQKIETKNDEILKASWKAKSSRKLRFRRPTWRQVGTQIEAEIDVIFERRFFEKRCFSLGKTYFLEIQWIEVGSKYRSKIDVKNDVETESLEN